MRWALRSVAGRVLERELKVLDKVKRAEEKPCIYVMGGAKADDAEAISDYVIYRNELDFEAEDDDDDSECFEGNNK